MKHFVKILGLCALVSCAKEAPEEIFKLENVVFSVSTDAVKSSLNDHAVVWTSGADQIAIFDNVGGLVSTPFTVTDNKVDAQVRSGATAFYGLYPYDAAATISGSVIGTTLPTVQEATAGSFAPGANLALAYTTTDAMSLSFKNVGALVEFTLNDADVKSITLMGNNNEKIAGKVSIDYNGGAPSVTASEVSVTLQHADGSALASGTTYYFIVAPVTFTRGITFTLTKTDGTFATRVTSASVSFARNQFVKLGTMESLSYGNDLYAAFNAGATIEIAGVAYNKADFSGSGEIKALDSSVEAERNLSTQLSGKKAIAFLSGSTEFTSSASIIVSNELVIVNRYPTATVTYKPTKYSPLRADGSWVMKGIRIDLSSLAEGYAFNNSGTSGDAAKLHLDDCFINLNGKPIYYISSTTYGISSIRIVNTDILCANNMLINTATNSRMDAFKEVVFEDNNVFSATVRTFQVLNYANNTAQTNASDAAAWSGKMSIKNNIFYNLHSINGLFRHFRVASLEIGGNIYYSPNSDVASKSYYLFSSEQDKTVIKNTGDIVYGLSGTATWVYSGNGYGQPAGVTNALSNAAENPFTSFNTTTGAYVLKDAYKAYGPQNN